ncbi:MAG: transposase, partial [Acetobacteraceae bacterium]|nr:transposase [Acetobacteraceae bacterium]
MRVLSRRFCTLFLDRLRPAFAAGKLRFSGAPADLAEPPGSPGASALCAAWNGSSTASIPSPAPNRRSPYLGRYTHRVAIANSRLVRLSDGSA